MARLRRARIKQLKQLTKTNRMEIMQNDNETATANQIKDLIAQLTAAQQAFDEWQNTQPADLDAQRSAWLSIRDRQRFYNVDEINAWKAQEPGLASRPEVIETKRRISELQLELVSEQSKLKELVAVETPFAVYQGAVMNAENMIGGILQRLRKQRIESVLVKTYGTANVAKLPRSLTDAAKLHPSVAAVDTFPFNGRPSTLRESQITQQVVDAAATNVGEALQRLLDLIQQSNA
jgi:hypothetical protein